MHIPEIVRKGSIWVIACLFGSEAETTDMKGLQEIAILYGVLCGFFTNSPFEGDRLTFCISVCS